MRVRLSLLPLLLLTAIAAACSSDGPTGSLDATTTLSDSGPGPSDGEVFDDASVDAGDRDTGPLSDSGIKEDAGTNTTTDAGPMNDAGTSTIADAGPADAGALADTGTTLDAGTPLDANPPLDATAPEDAGVVPDAEVAVDALAPEDAGAAPDAAPTPDAGTGPTPGPGDLVFVELQGNPQAATDEEAEYIELINVSGRALDLMGCRLTHRLFTGSPPVASVGNYLIGETVTVAAGARVLLTRSGGGFFGTASPDHVYGGFVFSNGGAESNRIRLMAPSWNGSEPPNAADIVDEVITPAGTFDNTLRGRAWQLDEGLVPSPTAAANDDPGNWCYAASDNALAYWSTNWGTPGAPNACP